MNMCTKFQVAILKKRLRFPVLNALKGYFLRYLRVFRHFSDFIFFSDLDRSKGVLWLYFCVLDENLTKKHA